jgi:integral membrane sensor domain MASE1
VPWAAPSQQARRHLILGARILGVAAAYYLAAELGLTFALVRGQVTPLWPPTGIAVAALLLLGVRCWPGITIGALLANAAVGPTVPAVIAISAGNTLAPVCAYLLLTRVGFRVGFTRLRDVLALIGLGAFAGMLVSATIGTGTLALSGALPHGDFWSAWSVWWTGDAMGVLVVTPVLLVAATVRRSWRVPAARWLEVVALFVGTAAISVVVTWSTPYLLFLIFPMLIWAALRFQQLGAAPCNLIVTVTVVLAAGAGRGPFADLELLPTMITLQAFNGSATLTALVLAAVTNERNRAQRSVQRAMTQLTDTVRMLEAHGRLHEPKASD